MPVRYRSLSPVLAVVPFAAALVPLAAVTGCGSTPPPGAAAPSAEVAPAPVAAEPAPPADPAPADPSPAAEASKPEVTGPTATLDGAVLRLSYGGRTLELSDSSVHAVGKSHELHFQEPMAKGYNQIWLLPRDVQKGKPAPVKGHGMTAIFVQLDDGKGGTRNVSSSCAADGSVTYDTLPARSGDAAAGSVDVTITCTGVEGWSAPLVLRGPFAGVPRK